MEKEIEIDPYIQIRVLEHKLRTTQRELDRSVEAYVLLMERCNRISGDRERAVQMNGELLRRIDATGGYGSRLLLAEA